MAHVPPKWARHYTGGYECSSAGDRRFSALSARLRDGRTIEEAYQLDVKGYRKYGNDWRLGKGKHAINGLSFDDLWAAYLGLWRQWACENPLLIADLRELSRGRPLTDRFATTSVSQARALAHILEESESAVQFDVSF